MRIPIEIVAVVLGVLVTTMVAVLRSLGRRVARVETYLVMIMVMLRDRGFEVPDPEDTDLFRVSNHL